MKLSKIFTLAIAFVCLGCLCSCSDDEPGIDINNVEPSSVVGIWQWTCWEGTEDHSHFKEDYENDPDYKDEDRDIFIFEPNGGFIDGYIEPGEDLVIQKRGRWEIIEGEPNAIKLSFSNYSDNLECEFISLSSSKMQITYNVYADFYENNTVLTMKRISSVAGYDERNLEDDDE